MGNENFDLDAFPEERPSTALQPSTPSPKVNAAIPPARAAVPRGGNRLGMLAMSLMILAAIGWGASRYISLGTPQPTAHSGAPSVVRPAADDRVVKNAPPPSANDVSGSWALMTHVQSSSYSRYEGLHLGYRIQLDQDGQSVKGSGRKITQDGGAIGARGQTPIFVSGTIDGDRLSLTFDERGTRRATQGKFVLLLDEGDTLRGRFSSTAAKSSGTVEAHRLQQ